MSAVGLNTVGSNDYYGAQESELKFQETDPATKDERSRTKDLKTNPQKRNCLPQQ
jgi:hypothetical protein